MNPTEIALKRALSLLIAIKAEYKVILPDGTEHGTLEVVRKKKRVFKYGLGEMSAYYRPLVSDMQPGDMRIVPADRFDSEHLRGTMTGWFTKMWGRGAVITSINREDNTIEVLRVS